MPPELQINALSKVVGIARGSNQYFAIPGKEVVCDSIVELLVNELKTFFTEFRVSS